ncbi:hypothetical protein EBS40_02885 [bacterium]|nr:hypothetical protein [bacterium]
MTNLTPEQKFDPPKLNPHSFEYFVERIKEQLIPALDDTKESLLNNKDCIELMRKCWHEGWDIGHLYGYDEGFDDGYDE